MHTRQLCSKLRQRFPKLKIIVGMWGATEKLDEPIEVLRAGGADEVVVSLADAVAQLVSFASSIVGDFVPAPIPADEDERLGALRGLKAFAAGSNPAFNAMTKKLTRAFEVPIALITLIDRDHQHFKSQFGLPPEYAGICEIPRDAAICSYVVAANAVFVVEDLARDRRFANNPFLKAHHLRFYAGAPLRSINGQPVGALCILDTKPRVFGETEMRMLRVMGEEISDQLAAQVIANLNPQEMHVA
jgi:GAF domain-containing protein